MGDDYCYEKDELVEVALTDNQWVKAKVVSDRETRVVVSFFVPVICIERVSVVTRSFFGLRTEIKESETSKLVQSMIFSTNLVRKTAQQ